MPVATLVLYNTLQEIDALVVAIRKLQDERGNVLTRCWAQSMRTVTGVALSSLVPLPSSPELLSPQH